MRINNAGDYEFCRWAKYKPNQPPSHNISEMGPLTYFRQHMSSIRQQFLAGKHYDLCSDCDKMQQHGKVSGRQKQLTKIGVDHKNWTKTMVSSPWFDVFVSGDAGLDLMPVDWQIDIGNSCNSACLFCCPDDSSRLASEWQSIGFINSRPNRNWTDDANLVERFISDLVTIPNLRYLHFIGGEPVIVPAFQTILKRIVDSGLASKVDIGFTTNLTVWDPELIETLSAFHQVNVGMSIECLHAVNDYLRYPSNVSQIKQNAERWFEQVRDADWLCQIRTTPTWLSIGHLLDLYEYAWQNKVTVESCNFIDKPVFLRPSVLPLPMRHDLVSRFRDWIKSKSEHIASSVSVNHRNPHFYQSSLVHDLESYCNYLENEPDLSNLMIPAVEFLQKIEGNRKNSVLDFLPEYESILTANGYSRP